MADDNELQSGLRANRPKQFSRTLGRVDLGACSGHDLLCTASCRDGKKTSMEAKVSLQVEGSASCDRSTSFEKNVESTHADATDVTDAEAIKKYNSGDKAMVGKKDEIRSLDSSQSIPNNDPHELTGIDYTYSNILSGGSCSKDSSVSCLASQSQETLASRDRPDNQSDDNDSRAVNDGSVHDESDDPGRYFPERTCANGPDISIPSLTLPPTLYSRGYDTSFSEESIYLRSRRHAESFERHPIHNRRTQGMRFTANRPLYSLRRRMSSALKKVRRILCFRNTN